MIKCKVIEKFDLKDFDKLSNIKRKAADVKGTLFIGDEFECDEQMAKYLTGENILNKTVVEIIEFQPEVVEGSIEYHDEPVELKATFKPKKKKTKK